MRDQLGRGGLPFLRLNGRDPGLNVADQCVQLIGRIAVASAKGLNPVFDLGREREQAGEPVMNQLQYLASWRGRRIIGQMRDEPLDCEQVRCEPGGGHDGFLPGFHSVHRPPADGRPAEWPTTCR